MNVWFHLISNVEISTHKHEITCTTYIISLVDNIWFNIRFFLFTRSTHSYTATHIPVPAVRLINTKYPSRFPKTLLISQNIAKCMKSHDSLITYTFSFNGKQLLLVLDDIRADLPEHTGYHHQKTLAACMTTI